MWTAVGAVGRRGPRADSTDARGGAGLALCAGVASLPPPWSHVGKEVYHVPTLRAPSRAAVPAQTASTVRRAPRGSAPRRLPTVWLKASPRWLWVRPVSGEKPPRSPEGFTGPASCLATEGWPRRLHLLPGVVTRLVWSRGWCVRPSGSPALSDHPDQPRPDDGGALGEREEHGLARPSEGSGEAGGRGRRGAHYRPKSHQQRPPVRDAGPQHPGVDRWAVHTRSEEVSPPERRHALDARAPGAVPSGGSRRRLPTTV